MEFETFEEEQKYVIGYCAYCKDPVYEYEDFEYNEQEAKYYHRFCYEVIENEINNIEDYE
jgi:hypothetical protein